jgi:hypothetical protein
MQVDPAPHRAHPFRVHELAQDFELLDVWRVPLEGSRRPSGLSEANEKVPGPSPRKRAMRPGEGVPSASRGPSTSPVGARKVDGALERARFLDFVRVFLENGTRTGSPAADALFELRSRLGRWLGWDSPRARPIPGCAETSVSERLSDDDRRRDASSRFMVPRPELRIIYVLDEEALFEIANATIHALLHLGWREGVVELSVYIKSRGFRSRIYMMLIAPFRHWVVYRPWLSTIATRWKEAGSGPGPGPGPGPGLSDV